MVQLSLQNTESELKSYCQKWLSSLSQSSFELAHSLVTVANNYGVSWGEKEITDLTVEFEFTPIKGNEFSATINDIHVM
ncbi:hypothetical protein [Thalassotalea sp. ND16A]|uniref:hypothetical protein n=1 Tax=Thalassotalea sp. ND16A TaxID=1535422 RepID=UPI00051A2935|nr:hypothetical protein [Thalassotalea sp. ND16A]KGJ89422.1 hypothetical protein ND16A_2315 [Thalassotalea sp. ND16A]